MGGFCGFIASNFESIGNEILAAMLGRLEHRGQDIDTCLHGGVGLGLVGRGSIYPNAAMPVVLNGTISNIHNLRALLVNDGHDFETNSHAEVLQKMYAQYGVDMLSYLSGSFAFAIYDAEEDTLFCARDPFGIKPFYYTSTDSGLIFGTEIKPFFMCPGFKPILNMEALGMYLTFQYSVLRETFFAGVYKLPAGHYMVCKNGQVEIKGYSTREFSPEKITLDHAVDEIDRAVISSVEKSMEVEGEIGTFLSGGVDSSFLAARFGKHGGRKAFTVGFDHENYNEIDQAKELCGHLGLTHITKIIPKDEYWRALPEIQYYMDEPMADPAAMAFYFACKEAASHVDIALSGEGPDELFGGYNIYKEPLSLRPYSRLPLKLRKWIATLAKKLPHRLKGRGFLLRAAKTVEERFIGNAYIFSPNERDRLLKYRTVGTPQDITRPYYNKVKHLDDITKMQYLDINLWLTDDILQQADKMSGAHALELSTPLLSGETFAVASKLPVKHRVSRKETKIAFRKAAARHLPTETATRKKLGFPVPIRIWLREDKYYANVKSYFQGVAATKYFHTKELVHLLDEHYHGRADNSRKIWTVYMFLLWHEEYFL